MTHRMVRSVMTASVATASLDTPFRGLAAIMAEHGVTALPVLDAGGGIAGIVSPSDLIRRIVTLRGEVERKSMVPLAARMARSADGVVDVVNELAYAIDDSRLPTATELDEP
jgi:CBS-domain-containing membrane protein